MNDLLEAAWNRDVESESFFEDDDLSFPAEPLTSVDATPKQNLPIFGRVPTEFFNQILETMVDFSPVDLDYLLQVVHFAERFKEERMRRKLTQKEVGKLMCDCVKREFSQTTISRFEEMAMPFTNMVKLRPELQGFMDLTDEQLRKIPIGTPLNPRRRRSKLTLQQVEELERFFNEKMHREKEELEEIGATIELEACVVRNWFHNRRNRGAPTAVRDDRKRSIEM